MTNQPSNNEIDHDDRRRDIRHATLLKVEYPNQDKVLSDYLTNLSEGGVFIETNDHYELGQTIDFCISFPGLFKPIECQGKVQWIGYDNIASEDAQAGMGVQFLFPSPAHKQRIQRIVEALRCELRPGDKPLIPFRVLLAEDNVIFHDLFKTSLRRFISEVHEIGALDLKLAADGRQALGHIKRGELDMAIIDHFLPVIYGADLIRIIRKQDSTAHIPILAISAGSSDVREHCLKAGADLFLPKPLQLKQVLATLRLFLVKQMHHTAFM